MTATTSSNEAQPVLCLCAVPFLTDGQCMPGPWQVAARIKPLQLLVIPTSYADPPHTGRRSCLSNWICLPNVHYRTVRRSDMPSHCLGWQLHSAPSFSLAHRRGLLGTFSEGPAGRGTSLSAISVPLLLLLLPLVSSGLQCREPLLTPLLAFREVQSTLSSF